MTTLPPPPPPRPDRAATQVLHDEANARVVGFTLAAGQAVAPHRSRSSVLLLVVEGRGTFSGDDAAAELGPGQAAAFAPGELHAIEAGRDGVRFLAVIAPRPE